MATGTTIEIQSGELTQIVQSVFGTMMGLEVTFCDKPWFSASDRLTSAVHLTGSWNGAVMLECDHTQACQFAARFLSMDTPQEVDDDVRDILGELANMVGGNLKSVLTPGIQISMPSVVDGSDYHVRVCGADVRTRFAYECTEGIFWMTILSMSA